MSSHNNTLLWWYLPVKGAVALEQKIVKSLDDGKDLFKRPSASRNVKARAEMSKREPKCELVGETQTKLVKCELNQRHVSQIGETRAKLVKRELKWWNVSQNHERWAKTDLQAKTVDCELKQWNKTLNAS